MPKTALVLFAFVAGALLSDATHPAGQRFWTNAEQTATDEELGCTDDCLEPEMPAATVLECAPSKDGMYLRCKVQP